MPKGPGEAGPLGGLDKHLQDKREDGSAWVFRVSGVVASGLGALVRVWTLGYGVGGAVCVYITVYLYVYVYI